MSNYVLSASNNEIIGAAQGGDSQGKPYYTYSLHISASFINHLRSAFHACDHKQDYVYDKITMDIATDKQKKQLEAQPFDLASAG